MRMSMDRTERAEAGAIIEATAVTAAAADRLIEAKAAYEAALIDLERALEAQTLGEERVWRRCRA